MSVGIGCSSPGGGSRRQNIATIIQTAYATFSYSVIGTAGAVAK